MCSVIWSLESRMANLSCSIPALKGWSKPSMKRSTSCVLFSIRPFPRTVKPQLKHSVQDREGNLPRTPLRDCFAIVPEVAFLSRLGAFSRHFSACRTGQPTQHDAAHRPVDHRHPCLRQPLVILGEPSSVAQPSEGPFDHPSPRKHQKAAGFLLQPVAPQLPVAMMRHLRPPPSLILGPLAKPARVGAVGPQQLQPRQLFLELVAQEDLRAIAVVQARR